MRSVALQHDAAERERVEIGGKVVCGPRPRGPIIQPRSSWQHGLDQDEGQADCNDF